MYRILFVCSGNVCRSVIAEKVLRRELAALGVAASVGSAGLRTDTDPGTVDPGTVDPGTGAVLAENGFDTDHAVTQFQPAMFGDYDLIVALDGNHQWVLRQLAPDAAAEAKIRLLGSFDPEAGAGWDVPDPVGGGAGDYARTFRLITSAMPGLLAAVAGRCTPVAARRADGR